MLLVLAGVCVSICLWEIVRFYKFKSDSKNWTKFKDEGLLMVESAQATHLANNDTFTTKEVERELKDYYSPYQEIKLRLQQYQGIHKYLC